MNRCMRRRTAHLTLAALLASGAACYRPVYHWIHPLPDGSTPSGDVMSGLESYPGIMKFGNKNHSSNVLLVHRDWGYCYSHVWILRVAWADGGMVVEVQMAPGYEVDTYFYARQQKALKGVATATRFVGQGELAFLEQGFIESLPLAVRKPEGRLFMGDGGSDLYFCILPKIFTAGITLGSCSDGLYPDFGELNPGYAKLSGDYRNAIVWVFADWLMEDGHKVDRRWLAEMRERFPRQRLDQ